MNDYRLISPLKALDMSGGKRLGPGNLGVVMARAGGGKTACLIHIAFDKLLTGESLVHVSLDESPEKVMDYYKARFNNIMQALDIPDNFDYQGMVGESRVILAYLNETFQIQRLRDSLESLAKNIDFKLESLVIDGVDIESAGRAFIDDLKGVASDLGIEMWLSALSHQHIDKTNERGIPYPLNELDDLFSVIFQLKPDKSGLYLNLLKEHENIPEENVRLKLDPRTFLVSSQ
jgi:hypothetical protein